MRGALVGCVVLLAAAPAQATALLVCSGPDAVVVTADSQGTWVTRDGARRSVDKIVPVGDRVLVAGAGLLELRNKTDIIFDQNKWVSRITGVLGPRPGAARVAEALRRAAVELEPLSSHRSVLRADAPEIDLLVVGFEAAAVVRLVRIELRPFRVTESEPAGALVPFGFLPGHFDDGSASWQLARRRLPWLAEHPPRATTELTAACGLLVSLEAQMNPSVGPPILQAILPRHGAIRRVEWAP